MKKPSLEPMLKELRNILLNNSDFPKESDLANNELRLALRGFRHKFKPDGTLRVDVGTVENFLRKYRYFDLYKWYLREFAKLGSRVIFIEGTDAVGKTSLANQLGRDLDAMPLENQSSNVFYELFKLPKEYRMAVADYNSNVAVGLLFYLCTNMYALDVVLDKFREGYRYAIVDSSLLRTLSSRIAIPAAGKSGLKVDKKIYNLVKEKLDRYYLNSVKGSRKALFVVFLYATAEVKHEQSAEKGIDYLHYESNKRYPLFVENYLRENELMLKRARVPLMSIELVTKKEGRRYKADVVLVRTNDVERDVREKARMIIEAMRRHG